MKKNIFISLLILFVNKGFSQTTKDTALTDVKNLKDITIVGNNSKSDYQQIPEIVGTNIYAGKKSTLILMNNVQGNVVSNNMRQVLAKVPGIHIWESDPSGIQIGIASRGLSPNRSWEFNIRQNGYDIAADPFGYPEAYYNPQLQAVQRIEIVRGSGSLQYGPQFGGMVNYILKNGSDIKKEFEFETHQTFGSNSLFNTFNAIGGKTKSNSYYAFFDHRNGNGWRKNSFFYTNSGYATFTHHFSDKISLNAEVMQSHLRSQQPGGLTDNNLYTNPQQSLRSRNWFDILWTTPAINVTYDINLFTKWNTKIFATIGDRNSVGYLQSILIKDSINPSTNQYNNRLVNIDKYRNYGLESRIITTYKLAKTSNTFSAGIRLYTGETHRQTDGVGTTGSEYDVAVLKPYPKDIVFSSKNIAAFVENIFRISKKLYLIPGMRFEVLSGNASGRNGFKSNGDAILLQNIERSRSFILFGMGGEYHTSSNTEIYANISEAYRPIQFANLQAAPTTDVVDPDLQDAKGYNAELGFRGKHKNWLTFDISCFYLQYNNRVGTINVSGTPNYRLITNIGNSVSKGVEGYFELNLLKAINTIHKNDLLIFGSYSYTNALYDSNHKDASTKNKRVENAPQNILRSGITLGIKSFLFTTQLSYVDKSYSDANNTEIATPNAQNGLIPQYTIIDITTSYKISKQANLKIGINNVTNETYFTRRAGGYPGPGALPADGRTFFINVGLKL